MNYKHCIRMHVNSWVFFSVISFIKSLHHAYRRDNGGVYMTEHYRLPDL